MVNENDTTDSIGYKKPPRATQFKPGQSGNTKGRPKGAKNIGTTVQEELDASIIATEGGKRKRMSRRRALIKQLVNKALATDMKAVALLFDVARQYEGQTIARTAETVFQSTEDRNIWDEIKRRVLESAREEQELSASDVNVELGSPGGPASKPEDSK